MPKLSPKQVCSIAMLSWVLTPPISSSHAGEFHFENFRYGQRAMGMGGAVVGIPFEPESTYYNPAGLALMSRGLRFSGALNFFGYDRRIQQDALRDGDAFTPSDLESTSFLPEPSSSVISKSMGRHVLALSSFLLSDQEERFDGIQKEAVGGGQLQFETDFFRQDTLRLHGLTYAYRFHPSFALGVSVYLLQHTREETARRAQVFGTGTVSNLFIDITHQERTSTFGLLAKAGMVWRPNTAWSLGAACTTPVVPIVGESSYGYTVIASGDRGNRPTYITVDETVTARTELPINCRLGAARNTAQWLVSMDLSLHLPLSYTRFDLTPEAARRDGEFGNKVQTDLTINAALGAEYHGNPYWPWRVGFFTNRSSAPDLPRKQAHFSPAHIDLYGITTSIGYLGKERSLNLGFEVQYGKGDDLVSESTASLLNDAEFTRVGREEWRVIVFVAGAIAFAKGTAKDFFAPKKGPKK